MPCAEVVEVGDLVPGTEVNVLWWDPVSGEPGSDTLGPCSGDDSYRETVHRGHPHGKAVLGVIRAVKLSFEISQNPAVRHHSVNVESECLNIF